MEPDFQESLRNLLLVVFPREELRDFLVTLPRGQEIHNELPGAIASRLQVAGAAAELLVEFNQSEIALARLDEARPQFGSRIAEILTMYRSEPPASKHSRPPIPAPDLPMFYVEPSGLTEFCGEIAEVHPRLAGISGPLGAGKSVFAAAVARSLQVEKGFARVCWLAVEDQNSQPVRELQKQLYRQLGGQDSFDAGDWREGRMVLARTAAKALGPNGRLLIVVDDPPDPMERVLEALTIEGRSTIVLCSENRSALSSLGAQPLAERNGMDIPEALKLLAAWCKCKIEDLPKEVAQIAAAVDRLPMALAIVGSMVAGAANPGAEWVALDQDITSGRVSHLHVPGLPNKSSLIAFDRALRAIGPSALNDLQALALLPGGASVETATLQALWAAPDADAARRRADELAGRSMLRALKRDSYGLHRFVRLMIRALDANRIARFREVASRVSSNPPLVLALSWRDEELFNGLLEQSDKEEIDRTGDHGVTPLQVAALNGMEPAVGALLMRGANPALMDDSGFTPLLCAAQSGAASIIESLLTAGVDRTAKNSAGATALDVAARWGHIDAVRLLAADAATVGESQRALSWATNHKYEGVVAILLSAGANPNAAPGATTPALIIAAHKGLVAIAAQLLKYGAIPDRIWNDQTALFLAASEGHAEMVDLLIGAGADGAWKTATQRTIVHQAAQSGNARIVARLIAAGGEVNARDEQQSTPLHVAAALGRQSAVAALVQAGAELNLLNRDELTPLHLAAASNHAETVESLLAAGANPDPTGQRGFTPLLAAVANAPPSIRQSSSFTMDERGVTAAAAVVYQPIGSSTFKIIRDLVHAGADINASQASGWTALHLAVKLLSPELVDLLLRLGANPLARDSSGRTPRDLAITKSANQLLQLRASAVQSLLGDENQ